MAQTYQGADAWHQVSLHNTLHTYPHTLTIYQHKIGLATWGPAGAQNYQGADAWHVVSLRVDGTQVSGYIDGYTASGTPPLYVTGETPAAIEQMRIGMVDVANSAGAGFGNVDVAEIMVYDKALTMQV
jgi:hypothetical protein